VSLTFVSVVHEVELPLLHLQARSFAVHVPRELAGRIIAVDNTTRGLRSAARARLVEAYGALSDRVEMFRPAQVVRVPPAVGWRTQQVFKLAVADLLGDERYVVLDAKNHFVGTPQRGHFETPEGRAVVTTYGYTRHPLRASLERVLRYVGLDPAPHLASFTATVTPFVLDAALVRQLMRDVSGRAGRSFAAEFVGAELTEFFLYTAWLLASGRQFADVFQRHDGIATTVWPRMADAAGVATAVARVAEQGHPVFSVHRRALTSLDGDARQALVDYWTTRGLFDSRTDAGEFLAAFALSAPVAERRQRRRELPVRALTGLRRLERRAPLR
jgi:hypothetical protein